jgi:hypothetical protein
MRDYHISYFKPLEHWPKGGWSVYRITGDQIAERIKRDAKGKIVERHSWCGFLGIGTTLDDVRDMIAADHKEEEEKEPRTAAGSLD